MRCPDCNAVVTPSEIDDVIVRALNERLDALKKQITNVEAASNSVYRFQNGELPTQERLLVSSILDGEINRLNDEHEQIYNLLQDQLR